MGLSPLPGWLFQLGVADVKLHFKGMSKAAQPQWAVDTCCPEVFQMFLVGTLALGVTGMGVASESHELASAENSTTASKWTPILS